jgi:hypothetical protein
LALRYNPREILLAGKQSSNSLWGPDIVTDKDKFDGCMKLAEFAIKNFHGRREYEWKITLGYWTILAAAIVSGDKIKAAVQAWVVLTSSLIFAIVWLRGVWVANANDKKRAFHYRDSAVTVLNDPEHKVVGEPEPIDCRNSEWWTGFLADWSSLFQLITTSALSIVLYRLL